MELPIYRIIEGRRPAGLVMPEAVPGTNVVGDYFARAAYLDAASAIAWARLGRELEAYGAPEALVSGCARARVAELGHARHFGRLAIRHGARPTTPEPCTVRVRPLVDVARANIVEGFVRQTYGATVARFRARTARDPELRLVMEQIAHDECETAELAFDVSTWLQASIDPVEGAWVEDAMRHAVVALARELDVEVAPELCVEVGLPSRVDALAIWSGLSKRVWHGISERVWNAAA